MNFLKSINLKLIKKMWTLRIIPCIGGFEALTVVTIKRYYLLGRDAV
jgi:hypothetical protein